MHTNIHRTSKSHPYSSHPQLQHRVNPTRQYHICCRKHRCMSASPAITISNIAALKYDQMETTAGITLTASRLHCMFAYCTNKPFSKRSHFLVYISCCKLFFRPFLTNDGDQIVHLKKSGGGHDMFMFLMLLILLLLLCRVIDPSLGLGETEGAWRMTDQPAFIKVSPSLWFRQGSKMNTRHVYTAKVCVT